MAELRKKLINRLEKLSGIDVRLWKPDSHLMVIYYKEKEVAHFHGNNELDIRLSKEVVKRDGLTHAPNHIGHPNRKDGGRWLIARFTRESHLSEIERLVNMAIELR
ncbi:MAG: luciferase family protein [Cocleimonas sp.]